MDPVPGTATFAMPAAAYDGFMGRYSTKLAVPFADFAGIRPASEHWTWVVVPVP